MISFKTYDFGTYALLNDRHAHMPFQSWRMRPKSVNNLFFTLNTQSFEIIFEVRVSFAAFYFCKQDLYLYKFFLSVEKKTEKQKIQNKKSYTHTEEYSNRIA
jgi:hypothetical protein